MTYRVGPQGQVVLPKRVRDGLGIRPGDDVTVERDNDSIPICKAASVGDLWGALSGRSGDALIPGLEADYREEIARDQRRVVEGPR